MVFIYIYIQIERLLYKLKIDNLRTILEYEDLIIKNDYWLLNVLMKWYKNEKRNIEDEEEKKELREEFKRILEKSIHFEKLQVGKIDCEIFNELKVIEMSDYLEEMNNEKKYNYLDELSVEDERVEEVILKYYRNEEEELIKEEDMKILNDLKEEEFDNMIMALIRMKNVKIAEIAMMIIISKKINIESINNKNIY